MNEIVFNLGDNAVPVWATPKEFLGKGKKIAILNFERLSKEKGETDAKFLDNEGMTYRLSFRDFENKGKERHMEVHARGFKEDIAKGVKQVFGTDRLPVGAVIYLKVELVPRKTKVGVRDVYQWSVEKAVGDEEPVPTIDEGEGLDESWDSYSAGEYDEPNTST